MTLSTPLKKVKGLGSAKSGTEHFWQQRLTGLLNLPLLIFFVWFVVHHLGANAGDVKSSIQNPVIAIALMLTLASVFWHMRLGMQVIIEDYVHGHIAKLAYLMLNTVFTLTMFAIAAFSILKMSFAI
jgi:succinate dehydrogenase / fumarate reductase, membrane anchor subunit